MDGRAGARDSGAADGWRTMVPRPAQVGAPWVAQETLAAPQGPRYRTTQDEGKTEGSPPPHGPYLALRAPFGHQRERDDVERQAQSGRPNVGKAGTHDEEAPVSRARNGYVATRLTLGGACRDGQLVA